MSLRKFIFVIENDIISDMVFDDAFEKNAFLADKLLNNEIKFVEIPEGFEVEQGWKYENYTFVNP